MQGNDLFIEYKSSFVENYVAQELKQRTNSPLYYWASAATAEIDFVLQHDEHVWPLEVKAGVSTKKKSLLEYGNRYPEATLSRSTLMNFKQDGRIRNYPLYAVSRFPI